MKISLLIPEMDIGGVEQGTYDLAKGFVKKGHTVFILSSGGRMLFSLEKYGIKTEYFSFDKKNFFSFIRCLRKLRRHIEKEKVDIIHARSRFPAWIAYFVSKNYERVHFVTSIHGFYKKYFYSKVMVKGERVIAVSEQLKKYAIDFLKGDERKIRIVYNGIDFEPLKKIKKQTHPEFIIGGIGRFTKVKGFQYILSACKRLEDEIPNLKILLVGEGRYKSILEEMAKKYKINIEFQKGTPFEFLPVMDLLIAPHENPESSKEKENIWIGRSAIEAQFFGIPIITTMGNLNRGEVLIGKKGIYIPPKDIEALSKAILHVYKNYSDLKDIIENAKTFAKENFTVDKMVEKTLSVYQELVSER